MTWHYALSDLFIPPLGFAWLALAALLVSHRLRRRRGLAIGVATIAVALFLVFAMPGVGKGLLISLEGGLPMQPSPQAPPEAIVILSADTVLTTDGLAVGPMTLERILAGVRLYHRTGLPILVSGGIVRSGGYRSTFAALMTPVLEDDFRVPVRWQEARSETTWQNAEDSAAILLPLGIRSVYLVTHAWHERRAILAFRHFGMDPIAAPVAFDSNASWGYVPSVKGFGYSFYAIHEWLGLLDYRFKAWRSGPSRSPPSVPANSAR